MAKHPDCIYPLCGCAGRTYCKSDPMNTPLPCDVSVDGVTFRKGVPLRTFVEAATRWRREAFGPPPTADEAAANLALLQGFKDAATCRDGGLCGVGGYCGNCPAGD